MYLSKTGLQAFFQTESPDAVEKISAVTAGRAEQSTASSDNDSPAGKVLPEETITGVILAGGQSRRMGQNKAFLDMGGIPLIEKTYRTMAKLFSEVILITNTPEEYAFLNCRCQPDIYPGVGSIAGLHAALSASYTERIFVVPCDMPFLSPELITLLCQTDPTYDAVVPFSRMGLEPLHALYHRRCLPQLERAIKSGDIKLQNVLQNIWAYFLPVSAYQHIPDAEHSFRNINRPEDYAALGIQEAEPSAVSSHEFGAQ